MSKIGECNCLHCTLYRTMMLWVETNSPQEADGTTDVRPLMRAVGRFAANSINAMPKPSRDLATKVFIDAFAAHRAAREVHADSDRTVN